MRLGRRRRHLAAWLCTSAVVGRTRRVEAASCVDRTFTDATATRARVTYCGTDAEQTDDDVGCGWWWWWWRWKRRKEDKEEEKQEKIGGAGGEEEVQEQKNKKKNTNDNNNNNNNNNKRCWWWWWCARVTLQIAASVVILRWLISLRKTLVTTATTVSRHRRLTDDPRSPPRPNHVSPARCFTYCIAVKLLHTAPWFTTKLTTPQPQRCSPRTVGQRLEIC